MHQNVTIAEAVVLSCFDVRGPAPPDRLRGGQLPLGALPLPGAARADVVVAADDEGVVEAIDDRTLLVPVTHVLYKTGEIQDVEAIVERAHEHGALVVLDAYQSVGTVPLDVTALGVDFAVGGSVKWLCGGPGAGWLYVRPDLAPTSSRRSPAGRRTSGPSTSSPSRTTRRARRASSPARRTCPRSTPRPPGYDVIEEIGVDADPRAVGRADVASDRATRRGRLSGREPARPGPARRHGGRAHAELRARRRGAAARGILCDYRPDVGLRLGPHFFNTDDELRYAVEQIGEIAGQRTSLRP